MRLRGDSRRTKSWRWLWALGLLVGAWSAPATAETYLILSLIGDRFTVVTAEQQVGSSLDRNRQQVVPIAGSALDDFMVRVADATIAKVRPDASVTMLRASDLALYALTESWVDADVVEVRALLSQLEGAFAAATAPRLLLIVPFRSPPDLRTDRTHVGTGKVAGLGFYLDPNLWLRSERTQAVGRGFLGIFANFQLLIIDPKSNTVLAHERIAAGTTHAAADAADATPWNALTDAQKMRILQALLKSEIERVLPAMLAVKAK